MHYWILCLFVFLAAYMVNILYVSVFYHRGLTHGAVTLKPWTRFFVVRTGNWVTGIDPKAWCCMHRMHHKYSDTPEDPHSPLTSGVLAVMLGQLHSYNRTLSGLLKGREPYSSMVADLDFPVNWLNRKRLWILPYLLHAAIATFVAIVFGAPLLALAYWMGIMSHPIQGWMVNAMAHTWGYRNFATADNSRNNTLVAWLVWGEGYQNNHHEMPMSAKFSVKWWEVDLGYVLCKLGRAMGVLEIPFPSKGSLRRVV